MTHPIAAFFFCVENLAIAGAYLFMAVMVAPVFLRVQGINFRMTKIGAVGFFLLCGMTHMTMAREAIFGSAMDQAMAAEPYMHFIHAPQAVLSWIFVVGLYIELVDVEWGRAGRPYGLLGHTLASPVLASSEPSATENDDGHEGEGAR